MKKGWIACLFALLSLGSVIRSQAQTTGETEKAVAALEQQWLQSQKTKNPDLVAPLLADKFVNTSIDGKVTGRAQALADAKATKYDSVDYDDLKVTVFGDAAIAIGTFKAKGTDSSGKPMDVNERFTDVGKDAERKVAVCCKSWLANKNVSNENVESKWPPTTRAAISFIGRPPVPIPTSSLPSPNTPS